MGNKFFKVGFIFLLIIGMLACHSNKHNIENATNSVNPFAKYIDSAQVYVFKYDRDIKLTGKEGTLIEIPEGCLEYQDGTLPQDSIAIILKEYYNPSEIIFNKMTTQGNNHLLETSGMIKLSIQHDGKKLRLRHGKQITIGFPIIGKTERGMKLYHSSKLTNEYIAWDENQLTTMESHGDTINDSIQGELGREPYYQKKLTEYLFKAGQDFANFGLINCDKIPEAINNTSLAVNIDDTTIIPGCSMVFNKIRMVAWWKYENHKLIFYNIPSNEEATIICYYQKDGKYFFYNNRLVIKPDMIITPQYREVTLDEMKREIDNIKWDISS